MCVVEEYDVVWCVVWVVIDFECFVVELYGVVVVQLLVGFEVVGGWEVEVFVLYWQFFDLEVFFFLWFFDWYVVVCCECFCVCVVIDVFVCEQYFFDLYVLLCDFLFDLVEIVVWIDDGCVVCFFVDEQ